MHKEIDIKNRLVKLFNVNTGDFEEEIVGYLDKQMKVRFFSAFFNNPNYVFVGRPQEQGRGSITVSSYTDKNNSNRSVIIE